MALGFAFSDSFEDTCPIWNKTEIYKKFNDVDKKDVYTVF